MESTTHSAWSARCASLIILALSWCYGSHALADEPWDDDPPECYRPAPQCAIRLGVGVEAALGISREESQINPRVAFRFNFPLTDLFEARTDLMVGGFPGFLDPEPGASYSKIGVGARIDLQLNLTSVYTLGIGADAVLAFWGGLFGTHASILGFRFGPDREFFINLPAQLWINLGSSRLVVEQLLSISYLFSP